MWRRQVVGQLLVEYKRLSRSFDPISLRAKFEEQFALKMQRKLQEGRRRVQQQKRRAQTLSAPASRVPIGFPALGRPAGR